MNETMTEIVARDAASSAPDGCGAVLGDIHAGADRRYLLGKVQQLVAVLRGFIVNEQVYIKTLDFRQTPESKEAAVLLAEVAE